MMPKSKMKSHAPMSLLSLMAERDNAIQERDLAISQKKAALAELEKAIHDRDAAIAARNNAIMERDNAINAFQQTCESMNRFDGHGSSMDAPYDHARQMHITDACPISIASKAPRSKWMRKRAIPLKSKSPRKRKTGFSNDLNLSSQAVQSNWKNQNRLGSARVVKNVSTTKYGQGNQDLSFNNITLDDSRTPVCSCTGKLHPCYKWGNCGWQSSCCTTTLSMHPLPLLPNRRYTRMAGRKMSGSVFRKLLIRLAAEGHDLSKPVDLKNHWAKHGTNAYIIIR